MGASSFRHVINPFHAEEGTAAWRIQQVTIASLLQAAVPVDGIEIRQIAVCDRETEAPVGFEAAPLLSRSVLGIASFSRPRPYALIADILQRAYDATEDGFIIYTNMDIIIQPYFYKAVQMLLADGADALIINRRRIADTGQTADDLPLILAEVGRSHPGFDCFVMHRSLVPKLLLDGLCVGIPFVEAGLMYNLMAFAKDCRILEGLHLTTHLGLDVMPPRDGEYHRHNRHCFQRILPQLKPQLKGKALPYSELPFLSRTWKRALNPAVFSGLHMELEGKSLIHRWQMRWNELRFSLLSD